MATREVATPRPEIRPPKAIGLLVRSKTGLRLSLRTFERLCRQNPQLRLARTAKGELLIMSPSAGISGSSNSRINGWLFVWNEETQLGEVMDSSTGYILPNGASHMPDASWIRNDVWNSLSLEKKCRLLRVVPDFVAELTSPSDRIGEVRERLLEFIHQGSRLGWLIDRKSQTVEIHRPNQPVEILKRPETLSGEDVLPGFVLKLKRILFD